jgi:hypothetical protein
MSFHWNMWSRQIGCDQKSDIRGNVFPSSTQSPSSSTSSSSLLLGSLIVTGNVVDGSKLVLVGTLGGVVVTLTQTTGEGLAGNGLGGGGVFDGSGLSISI